MILWTSLTDYSATRSAHTLPLPPPPPRAIGWLLTWCIRIDQIHWFFLDARQTAIDAYAAGLAWSFNKDVAGNSNCQCEVQFFTEFWIQLLHMSNASVGVVINVSHCSQLWLQDIWLKMKMMMSVRSAQHSLLEKILLIWEMHYKHKVGNWHTTRGRTYCCALSTVLLSSVYKPCALVWPWMEGGGGAPNFAKLCCVWRRECTRLPHNEDPLCKAVDVKWREWGCGPLPKRGLYLTLLNDTV